jgi:hypothetical protein
MSENCYNLGPQQPTTAQNKSLELRAGQRPHGKGHRLYVFAKTI